MARKSKADRINEILRANPSLARTDPRIDELITAEALLRKVQRAAVQADVTAASRNGSKRSPELVALDHATTAVRRLRNDLQVDRLGVKRNEQAGVKVKRSRKADEILAGLAELGGYAEVAYLVPGEAAFLSCHGIEAADLPEADREHFARDLAEQAHMVSGMRERLRTAGML